MSDHPSCLVCGRYIPDDRRRYRPDVKYCSERCSRVAEHQREREKEDPSHAKPVAPAE